MIPQKLKELLDKKFQVIDFVDLATLTSSPVATFKFFKALHRDAFKPEQRIVIYTSQDIKDDVLIHLYKTANFIDISNWFVLFCTPTDISAQLDRVCRSNSSDSVPFQNLVVPVDKTPEIGTNFLLPDTMCTIPWTNLEIQSDGTITPCCMSSFKFGNIESDRMDSVFYSEQMQNLRQQFLDGKKPAGCQGCWSKENQGLVSIRQHNIKRLKESFMTHYFEEPQIATIDLKFQNTCNFKCRICSAMSSSLYAEEQSKHIGTKLKPQLNWSESESFIEQINKLLPKLNNIDMYGGEPFLIKNFSKVLKTAVETGVSKNIRLHYNSNGSIWPERFIPYWAHFKKVDIHFSIDAIGKRFALQRGSTWEAVENNILKIKNLGMPNMNISIMPAVSIMNVLYIDEVLEWASKHKFQVFVSHVTNPREFGLINLTQEARDLINAKYKNSKFPEIQEILKSINSSPAGNGRGFSQKIQWFDKIRGENFSDDHLEIAKAMGYVYNTSNDSNP